ncbi:hypothetical protein MKZ38_001973 [Zalerion maritima]|uniref:Uncharacterized protein n=1 Tax=Zalerion maritima TaxID=339359 RepID=A0AAD5RQY7_9PEZI|nr:hypothetical protein MKZ38_001973 [Zalerion maritima]
MNRLIFLLSFSTHFLFAFDFRSPASNYDSKPSYSEPKNLDVYFLFPLYQASTAWRLPRRMAIPHHPTLAFDMMYFAFHGVQSFFAGFQGTIVYPGFLGGFSTFGGGEMGWMDKLILLSRGDYASQEFGGSAAAGDFFFLSFSSLFLFIIKWVETMLLAGALVTYGRP